MTTTEQLKWKCDRCGATTTTNELKPDDRLGPAGWKRLKREEDKSRVDLCPKCAELLGAFLVLEDCPVQETGVAAIPMPQDADALCAELVEAAGRWERLPGGDTFKRKDGWRVERVYSGAESPWFILSPAGETVDGVDGWVREFGSAKAAQDWVETQCPLMTEQRPGWSPTGGTGYRRADGWRVVPGARGGWFAFNPDVRVVDDEEGDQKRFGTATEAQEYVDEWHPLPGRLHNTKPSSNPDDVKDVEEITYTNLSSHPIRTKRVEPDDFTELLFQFEAEFRKRTTASQPIQSVTVHPDVWRRFYVDLRDIPLFPDGNRRSVLQEGEMMIRGILVKRGT